MKCKYWKESTLVKLMCAGILLCCQLQSLDGKTQEGAGRTKTGYTGADKILIPHKSWPCGMAAGIPVPERGVLVFEASLKLDQAYELGKTPYGLRNVFVFQEGTVSG